MSEEYFVKDYKEWKVLIEEAVSKSIGAPFNSDGLKLEYFDANPDLVNLGLAGPSRCYVTLTGYIELDKEEKNV